MHERNGRSHPPSAAPLAHASLAGKATGVLVAAMLFAHPMKRFTNARTALAALIAISVGALVASDARADGKLGTLPHGTYECSLPGSAGGRAWNPVAEEAFRIASASSYRSPKGRGTYIMRGKQLTFTRGPKKGEQFRRFGDNSLRKLDANGEKTRIICFRTGSKFRRAK
jgi:hypothetical protein